MNSALGRVTRSDPMGYYLVKTVPPILLYGKARPARLHTRVGDGRIPFLRARLVDAARRLPADARRRGARGRKALARAARSHGHARAPTPTRLCSLRIHRARSRRPSAPALVARMILLAVILCLLVVVAASARVAALRESRRSGLPDGALLYSDTGKPVGRIAPAEVGREGVKQERPLVSEALGLVGRPDYLIEADGGVVPVEAKSSLCPPDGRPRDSHVAQLAAYCLLVEEELDASVPYGVIKYRDRDVRVEYTDELKEWALALIEEMRAASVEEEVHRSHDDPRRCAGCSLRDVCVESLA